MRMKASGDLCACSMRVHVCTAPMRHDSALEGAGQVTRQAENVSTAHLARFPKGQNVPRMGRRKPICVDQGRSQRGVVSEPVLKKANLAEQCTDEGGLNRHRLCVKYTFQGRQRSR